MRGTRTYAILEVSSIAYDEIAAKLKMAGYDHAFLDHDDAVVVAMDGIALRKQEAATPKSKDPCSCGHACFHHDRTRLGYRRCWVYLCPCVKYEPVPRVETP